MNKKYLNQHLKGIKMNFMNHTPIAFKAQEPAIFDYEKMKKIAERNPQTYSRRFLSVCFPKGIYIDREINGAVRRLSYENCRTALCESTDKLYEISHGYKPETYNYATNTFSRAEHTDYKTMIISDGKGNYYVRKDFSGKKKPLKKFENFPEMLAFFRKYKAMQEKGPSAFKRILSYITDNNFEDVKINSTDKNVKEKLVKIAQKRMNTKSFLFGLGALQELPWIVAGSSIVQIAAIELAALCIGLICKNAIYDRKKLMKSPLYKEYKASLPESTSIMQRTIKVLQKPMRMIKK